MTWLGFGPRLRLRLWSRVEGGGGGSGWGLGLGLGLGLTRPAQAGEIAGSHLTSRAPAGDRAPLHAPHPLPALLRSSFASQKLLGELLLNGNEIGRSGATKLIQYARVRVRGRSRCR
jgi:hypothetical protein